MIEIYILMSEEFAQELLTSSIADSLIKQLSGDRVGPSTKLSLLIAKALEMEERGSVLLKSPQGKVRLSVKVLR